MAIVETERLGKRYRKTWAVRDLDLAVKEGCIFALLGPNGAGKTTTVRMLTTAIPPHTGTARVCGYDVRTQSFQVRRNIALVPQGGGLTHQFNVYDNIWLYLVLRGLSPWKAKRLAREALERFDLAAHARKRPSELSGGLRRRVDVGRVPALPAPVVFLDEPTTGLDPVARRTVWSSIREARERGATVFLTTQAMDEVQELADEVCFLREGVVVWRGSKRSLLDELGQTGASLVLEDAGNVTGGVSASVLAEKVRFVEGVLRAEAVGEQPVTLRLQLQGNGACLPQVISLLYGWGHRLAGLQVGAPTVEEVYLQLFGRREADA
ncbi:MAG: ABC transporter ATP-binding protein [Bacillota bacterium]|nr:ABC transporter ATP-binding protein [Bacillota bacterium]